MENSRKTQSFTKLRSLVKRKKPKPSDSNPDSPQLESIQNTQKDTHNVDEECVDRQQVKARYVQAATFLQEAVRKHQSQGKCFDFPDLSGEMEEFNDQEFRDKLSMAMNGYKESIQNQIVWGKCGQAIQCVFTALSPFAKNFLLIAREGQAVIPLFHLY